MPARGDRGQGCAVSGLGGGWSAVEPDPISGSGRAGSNASLSGRATGAPLLPS